MDSCRCAGRCAGEDAEVKGGWAAAGLSTASAAAPGPACTVAMEQRNAAGRAGSMSKKPPPQLSPAAFLPAP